jgi:hypothetical protein
VCPVCLAAIMVATATSGGGLWALALVVKEEDIGMEKNSKVEKHKVGTRGEWLAARLKLLTLQHAGLSRRSPSGRPLTRKGAPGTWPQNDSRT